jgi:aspartyl protease family protein
MNNKLLFLIFIGLITGLIFLLNKNFPNALSTPEGHYSLISSLVILLFLSIGIFRSNTDWSFVLKNAVIWLGISFVLVAGYSYQYSIKAFFNPIIGNIAPSLAQNNGNGTVTIYAGQNGHFTVNALVNGANVEFLLDTGASEVVLTPQDAKNAGIDISNLAFSSIVQTANGNTSTAPVTLDQVQVGNIALQNVEASISQGGLDTSLLGMSFLTRLGSYSVSEGKLTMSQ